MLKAEAQDKPVDQQESVEYQEMNAHGYDHLIFKKDVKNIHWRKKKRASLTNGAGRTRYLHAKE